MDTAQERYRVPPMKASDADRDTVVTALSEHFQAGRLTSEELDERTGRALAARTLDELDELTTDLPSARPPAPYPAPRPDRIKYAALAPIAVALAGLVVTAAVLGAGHGSRGWGIWWVIPAVLLVIRRLAGRRSVPRGYRRGLAGPRAAAAAP